MISVDVQLAVSDGQRRFAVDARWASDVPVTVLYGPSGAGKSLTLRALAGLLQPEAGCIQVNGKTWFDPAQGINRSAPQRQVGYLFQHYALFPHLNVFDNVAFGLSNWRKRLAQEDAVWVQELLDSFGLAPLARSKPAFLSGGQQQRVALARALACRPSLMLLDEPFAALNPQLRDGLRTELRQLCQHWRIPIVLITHDIEDVLALADVVFVYEQGAVVRSLDMHSGQVREQASNLLLPPRTRAPHVHEAVCRSVLLGAGPHV